MHGPLPGRDILMASKSQLVRLGNALIRMATRSEKLVMARQGRLGTEIALLQKPRRAARCLGVLKGLAAPLVALDLVSPTVRTA